jgi:hypothetical protein
MCMISCGSNLFSCFFVCHQLHVTFYCRTARLFEAIALYFGFVLLFLFVLFLIELLNEHNKLFKLVSLTKIKIKLHKWEVLKETME